MQRFQVDHLSPARCGLAWSPDGSMVAVPGHEHDVVCYERLNWKPLLTLRGEHTARVNLIAFAPDGAQCEHLQPIARQSDVCRAQCVQQPYPSRSCNMLRSCGLDCICK